MRVPRISLGKLFNVLQSSIGWMASWPMRNIKTFPSKQMYLYLSLVERKEAEFYHNIDRRRYLVWFKWLIFIAFPGQCMVSLSGKSDEISHLNQTNSAFYLYYDRTRLLFSRPMRVKDTSALREMFQHNSLVRASRPMPNSNTLKSFLLPRPELTKPCLMTYCPWQLLVSLASQQEMDDFWPILYF